MTPTTDDYIKAAMHAFKAERGEKFIHAGGLAYRVRTPGERLLHLPNGHTVKVTVDDSGVATQVEEDEKLHAIVRPGPINLRLRMMPAASSTSSTARPDAVHVSTDIRK